MLLHSPEANAIVAHHHTYATPESASLLEQENTEIIKNGPVSK